MKIARRGNISPFKVMEALREANAYEAEGGDAIHLSLGQPGKTAPRRVREKVAELLLDDHANIGYTEAMGLFPLRERIAQHYKDFYGVQLAPERVLVTVGSSSAMNMTLLSAFDYGDSIALALPCYPAYPNMLEALGLKPVFIRTTAQTNFQPTVEMLKSLPEKPDGMIIASPSNPTGTIIPEAELEAISRYCEENGIRLISDEIYHGVTYEG
ncbi:MAG: pyridoxal phosphate-dependent aminotransferase, partial [Rickettsiales bacterium]